MTDMIRLDGKVAAVVGGAGGIGEIMASGLAGQGAKVAIAGRNAQKLETIVKKIQSEMKSEAAGFQLDITNKQSVGKEAWVFHQGEASLPVILHHLGPIKYTSLPDLTDKLKKRIKGAK